MISTNYSKMKLHYDMLIRGSYPRNNGLESIRSTYENAFNTSINLFDVYESTLQVSNNPINRLITLVGPDSSEKKLPKGIIGLDDENCAFIDIITNDILKGDTDAMTMRDYIDMVFSSMCQIVNAGPFELSFSSNHTPLKVQPNIILLRSYPFYFMFHHIKESFPNRFRLDYFNSILSRHYASNSEEIEKILTSIDEHKYSTDPDRIYSIMTCKNTISICNQ